MWIAGLLLILSSPTLAERYRYDAAGRLVEVAYPDGSLQRYVYDANSNLLSGQVVGEALFSDGFES